MIEKGPLHACWRGLPKPAYSNANAAGEQNEDTLNTATLRRPGRVRPATLLRPGQTKRVALKAAEGAFDLDSNANAAEESAQGHLTVVRRNKLGSDTLARAGEETP